MPIQPTPVRTVAHFWNSVFELLPLHPELAQHPARLAFWQQTVLLAERELTAANRTYSKLSRNQLRLALRLFRGQDPFFKERLAERFYQHYAFGHERKLIRIQLQAQSTQTEPSTQGA